MSQAPQPPEERRQHPRHPTRGRFQCDLDLSGARRRFYVDDISLGGMKITSAEDTLYDVVVIGQRVKILAVGNGVNVLSRDRFGEVVWTAFIDGRFLAGIRFTEEFDELDRLLRKLPEH